MQTFKKKFTKVKTKIFLNKSELNQNKNYDLSKNYTLLQLSNILIIIQNFESLYSNLIYILKMTKLKATEQENNA